MNTMRDKNRVIDWFVSCFRPVKAADLSVNEDDVVVYVAVDVDADVDADMWLFRWHSTCLLTCMLTCGSVLC